MIRAIYFALCFGIALFGLFVITQINLTIGLSVFALFIVKFLLMLPTYQEVKWNLNQMIKLKLMEIIKQSF